MLDFDGNPVAVDHDYAACDRQVVGQDLDLVLFRCIKFYDGTSGKPHDLMHRHTGGPENDRQVDRNFIEMRHFEPKLTNDSGFIMTTVWLPND